MIKKNQDCQCSYLKMRSDGCSPITKSKPRWKMVYGQGLGTKHNQAAVLFFPFLINPPTHYCSV